MKETKMMDVRRLTVTAMLSALAYACVALSNLIFPIKIAGFLSLEPKDCILAVGAFIYGPVTGFMMSLIVALVEFLTVSTTGWIGLIMNVLSSALFVCPAALIYKRRRTVRGALLGLLAGAAAMTAGMLLWNYLITPLYMGVPRNVVVGMLLPVILPFNILKAGLNTALTMLLYQSVVTVLRKAHMLPQPQNAVKRRKLSIGIAIAAFLCTVTLLAVALVWGGVL